MENTNETNPLALREADVKNFENLKLAADLAWEEAERAALAGFVETV